MTGGNQVLYLFLLVTKFNEKPMTQQPVYGTQPQEHWFLLKTSDSEVRLTQCGQQLPPKFKPFKPSFTQYFYRRVSVALGGLKR